MESLSSCAPQANTHPLPPMAQAPKHTGVIIKSEFPSLRVCILPPTFYNESSVCAVSQHAVNFAHDAQIVRMLGAKIVRLPNFNELLDGFAIVEFFVEDFSGECGKFRVAGEAQRDKLIDGEFVGLGLQVGGKQALVTQALFEPDDAILNFKRHDPRDGQGDDESGGDEDRED